MRRKGNPLVALVMLSVMTLRTTENSDSDWLNCQQKPCLRKDQCVADEISVCPTGFSLRDGGAACGCCPGCVPHIGEDKECLQNEKEYCEDGTFCLENKCVKGACTEAEGHNLWEPRCQQDGSYAAVQCKGHAGSGRCFCWAPDGNRLDGQRTWDVDLSADAVADAMSCACSLRVWALEQDAQKQRQREVPRCSADGSFEALQCARGVCWCAEPRSGAPRGRAVPETAVHMLACYEEKQFGSSYGRRCDSQLAARALIDNTLLAHGTTAYGLASVTCDLDGSFGPVQISDADDTTNGQQRFCAWKDKTRIQTFTEASSGSTGMNCNCARDTVLLENNQLNCQSNGNYKVYGEEGDDVYCIDNDGFFMMFVNGANDCYGVPRSSY